MAACGAVRFAPRATHRNRSPGPTTPTGEPPGAIGENFLYCVKAAVDERMGLLVERLDAVKVPTSLPLLRPSVVSDT